MYTTEQKERGGRHFAWSWSFDGWTERTDTEMGLVAPGSSALVNTQA